MERNIFITITGAKFYYDMKPFAIDRVFKLVKEPDNEHDQEAIRAELPIIGKIGYVANSPATVVKGTISAGRLYDYIQMECFAQVLFVTDTQVIAIVLFPEDEEGPAEPGTEVLHSEIPPDDRTNLKGKFNKAKPLIGF